jgi:hypothetical protein
MLFGQQEDSDKEDNKNIFNKIHLTSVFAHCEHDFQQ